MTTMKDVSKLAGVSVGTVSRYVNNATSLKKQTKEAVKKAIEELNYIPNNYAKGLKMNSTHTIVLLIPSVWNPFFSEFAYYVEQNLSKKNYKMILCNSGHDTEKELQYIKMVVQNKVDGIIGITYNNIDEYISENLPFVSIDRYFNNKTSYVTTENYTGGKLAAKKLVEKGSKTLAYVGDFNQFPNDTVNRRKGFKDYVLSKNLSYYEIFEQEPLMNLDQHVGELIDSNVDGIFCVNDGMALRVIKLINKRKIKIPEQVQVIGYDGLNIFENEPLGISTIVQPVELMAKKVVDIVLQKISNRGLDPIIERLPISYREGKTTK